VLITMSAGVSAPARATTADTNNYCDQAGEAPDLIVGGVGWDDTDPEIHRWADIGGITAYSMAGTVCNIGTCWADWFADDNTHPVIGQNMFKLKDGRFQQIGQSWIKHTWAADTASYCGTCVAGDDGHLGVNCSDTYSDDIGGNGRQNRLGDKSFVDAYTGYYAFPQVNLAQTGNAIYKRLQVHDFDLAPASNVGAKYFAEMQYIQYQDATHARGENNASYRRMVVIDSDGTYNARLSGPTVVGQPAIAAWKAIDASVILTSAHLPDDGLLYLGTKVTYRGGGIWRYEYALQNLNANKAPLAISIPLPPGVTVSGASFHDVDYHSGSAQDNTNWARTTTTTAVQWKANTLVLDGLTVNALRWGTLYNFRIDVNAAPGSHAVLLGYNEPPAPTYGLSLSIPALTPSVCDSDGICDPGETCASCAADCARREADPAAAATARASRANPARRCFADCGQPLGAETQCGDGVDGDRDGSIDCFDDDCCADAACQGMTGFDIDGDGHGAACDCSDADGDSWKTPGELRDLRIEIDHVRTGETTISWAPADDPGGFSDVIDLIRTADPTDFTPASVCIAVAPGATSSTDPQVPPAGGRYYYLVRARNSCPDGIGPLGTSSSGTPHTAPACP
jgi:hypothetical protein